VWRVGQTLDRPLTVIRLAVTSVLVNSRQTLDRNWTRRNAMNLDHSERTLAARGLFLAAALLSFGLSVVLYFTGEHTDGIFVGLWVPSILALGAFLAPRRVPGPIDGSIEGATR
jgi:hypothetical protein